jgi:preprotein translocase subunit SecG
LLLVALALVVSGIISLVLLSRQRDAMSGAITSRLGNFRHRLDEGSSREDND